MSIVFLVPNEQMAKTAARVTRECKTDRVIISQGLLNKAIPLAKTLEQQDAEVFITRGGTALVLKNAGIQTPIVEIPITGRDMTEALTKARDLTGKDQPRIAVIAFGNMMQYLVDFIPLLNIDVRCYELSKEEEANSVITNAMHQGVDVVLGGVVTVLTAEKLGLPSVLLESGESSFRQAFEEARRIAYARRLESRRGMEFRAILEYAYEGIVAVNSEGTVTLFNPKAEELTDVRKKDALGKPSRESIPSLQLDETLTSGRSDTGRIVRFGHRKVILNRIPVCVNGEISGAVATFQDVTRIQDMEEQIRREIYSKGHVAKFRFSDIRIASPGLQNTITMAERYANTDLTVLLKGETGVGKELFAQSIHNASSRRTGPFVAVNCAALPENLLESELFGYVEGAFTGASRKGKPGLFELAHRGTIFLDEISEIPISLQGRLLRVLQEQEVMRLGHDRIIPIDVRVICATNRDLRAQVEAGNFRSDLYWRINVLSLYIPPLRERQDDILPLIRFFLEHSESCSPDIKFTSGARRFLRTYSWPGNVRELRNFCNRLAAMCQSTEINEQEVKEYLDVAESYRSPSAFYPRHKPSLDDILRTMRESGGSLTLAASKLGIHRSTLWRRLKRESQEVRHS